MPKDGRRISSEFMAIIYASYSKPELRLCYLLGLGMETE